jgi:DNA-binding beta-propeller fold protein YncE
MRIWSDYAVRAWPTLVLIDPTGRIVGETSGEIQAEELAQDIRETLEKNQANLSALPLLSATEIESQPQRPLEYPTKIFLAPGGNLFIADSGHHRIIQVQLDFERTEGEVVRVFGSGVAGMKDGAADEAQFQHPHGMALRGNVQDGTLYVADSGNHAIRAVELANGGVRTVAGTGQKAHGRFELGKPIDTPLRSPWALVCIENYVLIAMAGSHQIWALIDEAQIGPFAGTGAEALVDGPISQAAFNQPSDLALGMGYLFVADAEASAIRAVQLSETPETITLVGQGLFAFGDQDGPGESALLQHASGLALEENMLYVADTYNHKIKLLDPVKGEVETLIGSGQPGMADGSFASAMLFEPEGVQVQNGKVYIADTNNHVIRVGDLDTRRLTTLVLREMNLLRQREPGALPRRLEPVRVGAGARVILEAQLPAGYKRNPDAPSRVQVGLGEAARVYSFNATEEIAFPLDIQTDGDVALEVTLYYCTVENAGLCLIHDRKLLLPVQVSADGPATLRLAYPVE